MKAVITDGKGKVELKDVPMPECGDYDCLIKIEVCLFCNSTDRHIAEGTIPFEVPYPSILGHESVGVVESCGAKVKSYKPGDRVLRPMAVYPEDRLGDYYSSWGGLAEYGKITDTQALIDDGVVENADSPGAGLPYHQKVPADIPFEKSLLMITQKEIYSTVEKFEGVEGKNVLITGAGITAYYFAEFCKMKGAAKVTMTARRREPLDLALAQGIVDDVCLMSEADKISKDYDIMVEVTGSLNVAESMADKGLKADGTLYSYAVYVGMAEPKFFDKLKSACNFVPITPSEPTAHEAVIALIRQGKLDPAPYITNKFPVEQFDEAWKCLIEKKGIKTAVLF